MLSKGLLVFLIEVMFFFNAEYTEENAELRRVFVQDLRLKVEKVMGEVTNYQ
jgi:hypothetical protein